MNRLQFLALAAATLVLGTATVQAQQARLSPLDTAAATVDGSRVTVYYSRPFTKDPKTGAARKIWGGLVPFGKMWRLGANEPTMIITQLPLVAGGVTIPAGASSLTLLPLEDGTAKLVVNKQLGHWGGTYDEKQDIGRIDTKAETLEKSVDQLTIAVAKNAAAGTGGTLKISWENTAYTIPFTVQK